MFFFPLRIAFSVSLKNSETSLNTLLEMLGGGRRTKGIWIPLSGSGGKAYVGMREAATSSENEMKAFMVVQGPSWFELSRAAHCNTVMLNSVH
jgi:hypothetical protein